MTKQVSPPSPEPDKNIPPQKPDKNSSPKNPPADKNEQITVSKKDLESFFNQKLETKIKELQTTSEAKTTTLLSFLAAGGNPTKTKDFFTKLDSGSEFNEDFKKENPDLFGKKESINGVHNVVPGKGKASKPAEKEAIYLTNMDYDTETPSVNSYQFKKQFIE